MKILYIDPNNETPQLSYPLIESLQKSNKVDITLISSFNRFNSKHYHKNYKINTEYLFFNLANTISNKQLRQIVKLFMYLFHSVTLLKYVLKKKPAIVHYNWLAVPFIDYFLIKIFKLLKIKTILTKHNYYEHGKKKLKLFEKSIFNNIDKIVCLSYYVKEQFHNDLAKKIVFIEHGNSYEKEINYYSQKYKKKNDIFFNILFAGNIRPYKGVDLLLDAMNYLVNEKKITDIKLTIAGNCNKNY